MNEVAKARFGLICAFVAACLIVGGIILALAGGNTKENGTAENAAKTVTESTSEAKVEKTVAASVASSTPVSEKPSFWARLFGKKSAPKVAEAPKAPPPPKIVYRYKKPSENPNFGKAFDHSQALRGKFSNKTVRYGASVGTGILVDMNSRKVLWEYLPEKSVPVASMVKMMTLLLTMESLEKNPAISLESSVQITGAATRVKRTGVVWLDPREQFPLADLLKAVCIKSANDAAMQVAEFIGNGDTAAFIQRMNQRSVELGMTQSHFYNACGLPTAERKHSLSSAEDMVILGERLLEYPVVMEWLGTQQSSIREGAKKTMLTTTNNLVNPRWPGVDGLKTGYTDASGFCLTFSVLRGGRRLIGCVTGFKSRVERDRFCRKLIDWGYERAAKLDAPSMPVVKTPLKAAK